MEIEVVYSRWSYDGGELVGGVHEIENPSKRLLKAIGAAADSGAVVVKSASGEERSTIERAVQSQKDGEKAYAKAQESGDWHEGNLLDFVVRSEQALTAHARSVETGVGLENRLSKESKAWLESGLAQARKVQKRMESDGLSYSDAVDAELAS